MATADTVLVISAPGVPLDVLLDAQAQLALELNARAPIAEPVVEQSRPGTRGVAGVVGELALKLLSPAIIKHVAQVIVGFVKSNPKYILKFADVEITADRVSTDEIKFINDFALELEKIRARRGKK